MRKYSLLSSLFFLLFNIGITSAQSTLRKANKEYELGAFSLAAKSYLKYLNKHPEDVTAIGKLADSYRHLNQMTQAQNWYEKAMALKNLDPNLVFNYAKTLKASGDYSKAKAWFLNYAEGNPTIGNQFAESCDFAQVRSELPALYEVVLSGINTNSSEFGPSFFKDQLVFASTQKGQERSIKRSNANWEGKAYNQLYISSLAKGKAGAPKYLLNDLKNHYNLGPLSYSANGKWVAFTKNNFAEGTRQIASSGLQMSIYIAEANEDGSWDNLSAFPYNNESYANGFPSLSADGQLLYFASDRPDGFGGFDIFVSKRVGNTWSAPENLGAIVNTTGNEMTPFYDGKSVYFSSDWHPGFGGLDIFRAEKEKDKWDKVYHLGSKINSSRDDYGFVYSSTANLGFLTSNRLGGKGLEDIYQFRKTTDNIIITVTDESNNNPIAGAAIDFSACGERVFSTDTNGQYSFQALPGLECRATVRKDGFLIQDFDLKTKGGGAQRRMIEIKLSKKSTVIVKEEPEDNNENTNNIFSGKVINHESKNAEAFVTVRVNNKTNGDIFETETDKNGKFALPLVPNSDYIIRLSKVGFRNINKTITTKENAKTNLGEIPILPSVSSSVVVDSPKKEVTPAPTNIENTSTNTASNNTSTKSGFAIQIAAVFNKPNVDLTKYQNDLKGLGSIYKTTKGAATKIRVGTFATRSEAKNKLTSIRSKGYSSAFLITENNTITRQAASTASTSPTRTVTPPPAAASTSATVSPYKVRLGTFKSLKFFDESKLEGLGTLKDYTWKNLHIMVLEGFASRAEAEAALKTARKNGFNDAVLAKKEGGRLRSVK